jgi:hypothetical protein
MPFCPNCGYEYVEGIDVCPNCDEELVDFLVPEDNGDPPGNARGRVKLLFTTYQMVTADMVVGALESAGIHCLVKRGMGIHGQFGAVLGGKQSEFKIWVIEEVYEEALEIVKQIMGEDGVTDD